MGATKLMTAAGGGITLDAASTASDKIITVPAVTDTMVTRTTNVNSDTAIASTSGTSIDFTGIPSWVKRITVMFNGVSTNGTSNLLVQLGDSGGIEATSYTGSSSSGTAGVATSTYTTGFGVRQSASTSASYGSMVLTTLGSNLWVCSATFSDSGGGFIVTGGRKTLSDTLTQVRITTVNGTDTFDAGSVNILYE